MTAVRPGEAILEIRNLTKVFDKDLFKKRQVAINNLSCRFAKGRCTGFLGHNGAGKTTTIRTLFGLLQPTKGEILFKGRKIGTRDKAVIGYMPETNKLPGRLNALEILKHQLNIYAPDKTSRQKSEMVEAKLKEVGLWENRDKLAAKLSKGMGRRLAWAMATIHLPELVILDEPFSGMDPLGRRQMIGWIKGLKDASTSIMLCTHELWSMYHLCDDFHILRQGSLVFSTSEPLGGQDKAPAGIGQRWFLHLSGTNAAALAQLQAKHSLDSYDDHYQDGFLSKLQFATYATAAQWLKAAQESGYVIIKFESSKGMIEERILHFFEGGQG